MTKENLQKKLKELNVFPYRISNRLGKIILTISWKDYQFIHDTEIDEASNVCINMV